VTVLDKHVARRIKGKRIALGLAEIDLAAVLGVQDDLIEAYEKGTEAVPQEHLTRLSEYFGVPVAYFLPAPPNPQACDSGNSQRQTIPTGNPRVTGPSYGVSSVSGTWRR
jgi:transcriptional regulator with XRE-family HTH domain